MIRNTFPTKYWLHDDSKKVVTYLSEFHEKWSLWNNSPFRQAWLRNFIAYYSPVIHPGSWDTSLIFEGVQGELTRFYTPKARVLMRQLISILTKQRLAFQCEAESSSGSDVQQEIKLGNAITEQLVLNERLDIKDDQLTEGALVTGNWFLKTTWRTDKGKPYTKDDYGNIIYTGGIDCSLSSVFDTFYDITIPHWDHVDWAETRTIKNRWSLVAQHPELEREILQTESVRESRGPNTWFDRTLTDEDLIFVYEFYAKPSPALPKGRMIMYANEQCVFHDGENTYGTIPIEPMTPEIVLNTGLGYPMFTNIVASQEMYDNSLSAIATNQSQFAVQSVAIPRGSDINVMELNGMRFVKYTPQAVPGGGIPTPLQLTQSSPETFKFAQMLAQEMQDMSYLNGALVGKPPAGVTSGVAIATLSANALEFVNSIAKARACCWEKSMMHAVNAYQKFGKLEQSVKMKGKNAQIIRKTFTGEHIANLNGIKMSMANPLMQTVAGRLEIGQQLITMPKEVWPEYVAILEGRPLSDIYKGDLSEMDLIAAENDALQQGKDCPVLQTDDHPKHIMYHAALMNDPEMRLNNPNVKVILDHMMEHKNQAQNEDPFLTAMIRTGRMPQMPPPSPGGPPLPQGANGPTGAPIGPGPGPQGPMGHPQPPPGAEMPLPLVGRQSKPAHDLLRRQGM